MIKLASDMINNIPVVIAMGWMSHAQAAAEFFSTDSTHSVVYVKAADPATKSFDTVTMLIKRDDVLKAEFTQD